MNGTVELASARVDDYAEVGARRSADVRALASSFAVPAYDT